MSFWQNNLHRKKRFSSVVHLSVKVKKVNHKKSIFFCFFLFTLWTNNLSHTWHFWQSLPSPVSLASEKQKSKRIRDGKLRNQIVFFVTHIIFILMLRYLRKVPFDSTENKEDENCPNFTCSNKKISQKNQKNTRWYNSVWNFTYPNCLLSKMFVPVLSRKCILK